MLLYAELAGLGHGALAKKNNNARARSQSCSHVLPALLVIPQTNYAFSSSSSSLLFQLPQSSRSFQLQLDLDKDGFFPFLLHSPLLWLKRDLPVEITHTRSRTHTHRTCAPVDCSAETLHLRKNIFTNKQGPPPPLTDPPQLGPLPTSSSAL